MAEVLFHIESPSPRASYMLEHVLRNMLGWDAEEERDATKCRRSGKPFLIYGHRSVDGGYQVHPQGSLTPKDGGQELRSDPLTGTAPPMPYPMPRRDPLFDPFAAAFWLMTRQEEATLVRDEHGRPRTDAMHAFRHGFLQQPVVDDWVLELAAAWREKDDRVPLPRRSYRQVVTMDMDNGYKYRGRAAWRSAGSAVRDILNGRFREVIDRLRVLLGIARDPYEVDDLLRGLCNGSADRCMVAVLVASRGRNDHAVGMDQPIMRERVRALAQWAQVAIHPSYRSSDVRGMIQGEKLMLEQVLGAPVTRSRQHFLRLSSTTHRELLEAGIREEHSMGLHDTIGFRAGTCTPYAFYDTEREEATELIIHPFMMMDSALCYRMGLDPAEAIRKAKIMVDAVKRVQGTFISVWHERFLSDHGRERGWRRVAEEVIRYARP